MEVIKGSQMHAVLPTPASIWEDGLGAIHLWGRKLSKINKYHTARVYPLVF
jgi:hypothetical protein